MRFHFDPNRTKQQKQPKIEVPQQTNNLSLLNMDLQKDENEAPKQIQKQEEVVYEEKQQIFEPKESLNQLPDYQAIYCQLEMPNCNQNELYLSLYEQCFINEMNRFKEHYKDYPDIIHFSNVLEQRMLKFIVQEKKLKQQYCQPKQNTLPYEIKKLEYEHQIREYSKSIVKFQNAQKKITETLQKDIQQHLSLQMINNIKIDERSNQGVFQQRLHQFEQQNITKRELLIDKTNEHFIKLVNDSKQIMEENEHLEKKIIELEKKLGKKECLQLDKCFELIN